MNFITVAALAIVFVLAQANPARLRRDASDRYCIKHIEHYNKYCGDDAGPVDRALFGKVSKFCPAYEKHCAVGKAGLVELPDLGSPLVMPPVLPRGSDVVNLDLPIGDDRKPAHFNIPHVPRTAPQTTKLTAAIVATCTPECVASHCTDECKCAHTHPKVHQMCNPPSSAAMAATCQRWYSKCTMFTPVQY
ncbi:CBN-OSM-11 protein [Caenorhabditis brenneri]|uniref:CBN-OSM-11 protein n=1 Tax=Caenorhabditis brenneri TaxID=135651 RepID=G0MIF1_CAEBE|nr:CBN-OSM-11 protein [Caenorhabditis brenneri]